MLSQAMPPMLTATWAMSSPKESPVMVTVLPGGASSGVMAKMSGTL